jgi:protein-L-isoaspartate(D-aspartate) O-methyltransferase
MQVQIDRLQDRLTAQGIRDPRILRAFREVPRSEFCRIEDRALAWNDQDLPLPGPSRASKDTLTAPGVLAACLEALQVGPGDRVLELGTGSGYLTALLCELAGSVRSIELCPDRSRSARERLRALQYANQVQHLADGRQGKFDHAPFDAILCQFALPYIPPVLLDQLAVGARLLAPVGSLESQEMILMRADARGTHQEGALFSCQFKAADSQRSNFL